MTAEAWTDERVALLRELWMTNSAFDISEQLTKVTVEAGPLSRNAIIGKAGRLHLGNKPSGKKRSDKTVLKVVEPKAVPEPEVFEAIPIRPQPESRSFWTSDDARACRWPVGTEPLKDDYFCGEPIECGSYCGHHDRMAYVRKRGDSNGTKTIPNWGVRLGTSWV